MQEPERAASEDILSLENQVCFALAVAARNVVGLYRPFLEPPRLTHPQYLVMLALWEQSPRSVREIADALSLEPATLSPLLKRLEIIGYVQRERSARDERMLDITLTEAGYSLRSTALTIPPRVARSLDMSVPELESLREVLHRVIAASNS
ncbi:MarR family winged helix-turn-helix transcriptional regulator [Subtercola boreus]|uniref:MarR family transcriptional regulator n=1 Tax=Subtercola boreus TaxID=120213 RepID=A0A3E0W831_9MICO|nr:MarR family transcriptional regulator [Subtercola boreus]RFA18843.1 MarR family transcriptional regulator [Subtercola boreus]RFA18957.1 MarR family transcriptional regulator [Subtercola boreus]RFA25495.1 MarR family transcriptional regulator [Subtercola boreus]